MNPHSAQHENEAISQIERQRKLLNENVARLKGLLDEVERARKKPKVDAETSRKLAALQTMISSARFAEDLESLKQSVAKCKTAMTEFEQHAVLRKQAETRRKPMKVLNKI